MNTSRKFARNGSIALIAFVLLALPAVSVKAADMDSFDFYPDYSYDFYPDTSYDFYPEHSYDFYPEEASYDFYPDQSYDFYPDGYSYGSLSGYPTSYFTGSGYLGGSYISSPAYLPAPIGRTTSTGGQTQNQNQVSNNSNTNVNNNIITVNVPSPTVVYTTPAPVYNAPVCTMTVSTNYGYGYQPAVLSWTSQYATSGFINNGVGSVSASGSINVNPQYTTTYTGTFYGQNGQSVNCSATVTRGIVYNNTPYVALSAVPYTGLELGFWGTVAYFGFLVLWCLVAAYLIVVKKIHKSIASFLFGNPAVVSTPVVAAPAASYSAPVVSKTDAIDDFIMSQINRSVR